MTHWRLLQRSVERIAAPVIEFGIGWGSTPLLHLLCEGRQLLSVENKPLWFRKFVDLFRDGHEGRLVKVYSEIDIPKGVLLFSDEGPTEAARCETIARAASADARAVIVHDADDHSIARFLEENPFRYRFNDNCSPLTSVLSNTLDVEKELA